MTTMEQGKQIVLVVDGDPMRRFLTTLFLQRVGYDVFSVKTAEDALLILEMTVPLLIITEITLPRMNGIDLLKAVKQHRDCRNVPVLVYTSLKDPSYREACEQAGCTGYLTQPADHNQFYEAVQRATETTPRSFVRLPISLEVIVESESHRESGAQKERVTAISEHGMYVATKDPLPRDAVAPFTLFLDRSLAWGIMVQGTVLYSNPAGDAENQPGMGVKFTELRPEDREAIKTFIGKKLLEGVAVPVKIPEPGTG